MEKLKIGSGPIASLLPLLRAVITMLLFIKRELTVKRPLLDFNLFKNLMLPPGYFSSYYWEFLHPLLFNLHYQPMSFTLSYKKR